MDLDAVSRAIVFAEEQEIAPRFRTLRSDEVLEKSPGEVVTAADQACELLLSELLRDIRDVPVVGEEASAENPELIHKIEGSAAVWLVDPVDGTSNFSDGSTDYAVMVAFVEGGETTASWMWHPHGQAMAVGEKGSGAFINGIRADVAAGRHGDSPLSGVVKQRFLPQAIKEEVRLSASQFGGFSEGRNCAGLDYPDLVSGAVDFLFYWRTLPWDHAPGVLFAQEAGCVAQRPDGAIHRPGSTAEGLIIAPADVCDDVRCRLLGLRRRSE